MKMNFELQDKFRIMFYNLKMPVRKVKEKLRENRASMELLFVSGENDLINSVKGLEPQAIIINHHDCNDSNVPTILQGLRMTLDTPVIIWCGNMNEFTARKFLSFKNTYTLNVADGFGALNEILHRIEMKIKNPAIWV
jgi:hypothetical protein